MALDLPGAMEAFRRAQDAVDHSKVQVRESQVALKKAREDLKQSIVAEAKRGTRMRDLVATTGLSREWIRTILRGAGVEADG